MPRHNGTKLLSFSKLSFSLDDTQLLGTNKDKSPSIPLNDTLNLLDFTTNIKTNNNLNDDGILTDTSLSSINDVSSINTFPGNDTASLISSEATKYSSQFNDNPTFDDLISSREDSVSQSEVLSQDNYNYLLSSASNLKSKKKSMDQISSLKPELKKQLQLEWTAEDRKFNEWIKQKPTIHEIIKLNDDLHGNTKTNYNNLEFVWVKLIFKKNLFSNNKYRDITINCCWWPAQIALAINQEDTTNDEKISVQLFTSMSFDVKQINCNVILNKDYIFQVDRECVVPFKHLWTYSNIKIFKYVIQYHLDPLLLSNYNLHWLLIKKKNRKKHIAMTNNDSDNDQDIDMKDAMDRDIDIENIQIPKMSLKKRQKIFYREYKHIIRETYKYYLKNESKSAQIFNLNHCAQWIGDETINYKKAQIVMVKGDPIHVIPPNIEKKINIMLIVRSVWWPAIVLQKSLHHKNKQNEAVIVNLVKLKIQCDYSRINVIPIHKEWFSKNYGDINHMEYIEKLAEQILLTSKCNYKLHILFKKAITKISSCSFIGGDCYQYKQWKHGKKKLKTNRKMIEKQKVKKDEKSDKREMDASSSEGIESEQVMISKKKEKKKDKTIKKNKHKKSKKKKKEKKEKKQKKTKKKKRKKENDEKDKKHKKKGKKSKKKKKRKKRKDKKDKIEGELEKIYGKPLTSSEMKEIIVDRKNNRTLWNFCNNPASFRSCIRTQFHPVQLSFYLKPPPQEIEERQNVDEYNQCIEELSKIYQLKPRQKNRKNSKSEQVFEKNLRHRLYIRQNTQICQDILCFDAEPLMIMSTNCSPIKLNKKLMNKYGELTRYHFPRILSKSSLLPSGTASKAYSIKSNAWHRKNWFIIWYMRWIRLLQYYMQCRSYDYAIQIICLLLPVALREFNTFIHETEFIIKCVLCILNNIDDEYERKKKENEDNDIIYDNNHIHAINNLLDSFHENKHKGWKLSCLIGKNRFNRMNEILDFYKIGWLSKQKHFASNEMKQIFKDKQNKSNCDIQFLQVIVELLYEKHYGMGDLEMIDEQQHIEHDDNDDDKEKQSNLLLESLGKKRRAMISTRSRRKRIDTKRKTVTLGKRKKRLWNESEAPKYKKQKTMLTSDGYDNDDYAADTEDYDDDDDDDDDLDMDDMEDIEDEKDNDEDVRGDDKEVTIIKEVVKNNKYEDEVQIVLQATKWNEIMNKLERCFELNPYNDCYLFFMFQLLSNYKPLIIRNEMMVNIYNHIKRFISLQSNHPNGYRYIITFLFKYSECRPLLGPEMLLHEIFDYLIKLINIDPFSKCINASIHEICKNDKYISNITQNIDLKLQFLYIELLSIMNVIEIGDNCLYLSKWETLSKICNEIQSVLMDNDNKDETIRSILSLISDKNSYWKFIYFNSQIFNAKGINLNILWLKLKCCSILYGNNHPFIIRFIQKYDGIAISEEIESVLDILKKQNKIKCIIDLCMNKKSKKKDVNTEILHYGKLCVFEPIICCTPYYLRYSVYSDLMESWKSWKSLKTIDDNVGMHCDCSTPWNDKYKYELRKYKRSVLQQLNDEMRFIYFMFHKPFIQFSYSNPKSKKKLIESCWILIKKLKRMNELVSNVKLFENHNFAKLNDNVLRMFQISKC